MSSERFNVSVSAELFAAMEKARGDVPRSVFVKRALESALDGLGSDQPTGGVSTGGAAAPLPARPVSTRTPDEPVAKVLGSKVRKVPSLKDTWGR